MFLKFIVICASVHLGLADVSDYCWKDYKGVIPTDAFVGGVDSDDNNLYVAHSYKHNLGIIPHGLYGLPSSVGSKVIPQLQINGVQVLCISDPNAFVWKPIMESKNFLNETAEVELVKGGVEGNMVVYICKTIYNNQPYIGKILNRTNQDGTCLFYHKEAEYIAKSYETLIINNIDIRMLKGRKSTQ